VASALKPGTADHLVVLHVLSKSHWKDHPEFVETILKRGNHLESLVTHVLSQDHWRGHPEWVERLLQQGWLNRHIAREVLSKPFSKEHPEWVRAMLRRRDPITLGALLSHALSKPHWSGHPEFVDEIVRRGALDHEVAWAILSKPHWTRHPEWVETILLRGVHESLVYNSVLNKDHWPKPWVRFWRRLLKLHGPARASYAARHRPYDLPQGKRKVQEPKALDLGPAGRFEVLEQGAGHGEHGRVDKVRRLSDGQVFALKPRARSEHPRVLERASLWRKLGLASVKVLSVPGRALLLASWVEGKLLRDCLDDAAFWKSPRLVRPLRALIRGAASKGYYVGDLNPKNLVGSGETWQVIDSGSIRKRTPRAALAEFKTKLREKWSRHVTQPGNRKALSDFLDAL